MKLLVPVKCSELAFAQIAPATEPVFELCIKLISPVEFRVQLSMYIPAAPWFALFSRKVVFPMNIKLLLKAEIPPLELSVKQIFPVAYRVQLIM